ncbi:outer membrane lipoprotein carrier protein LolA [Streptomyces sp. NPDC058953]|uniref:LolA family protein n=1 Tax=unclassified Streptomyces TaxID=2593676 RepID=UPI0036A7FC2B
MARNDESAAGTAGAQTTQDTGAPLARRRRAARYALPVAVAGVAAATIGLVPALAASGDPDLPEVSAQELIERIAASETERLSGNVKISTDLGLPDFGGLGGSLLSGAVSGAASGGASDGGERGGEDGAGSSASPDAKLMELATGSHTLRVAVDGPERQKVSIVEKTSEYSLIRNGDEVWAYDSASNEVFHQKDPGTGAGASGEHGGKGKKGKGADGVPGLSAEAPTPRELAQEALKAVDETTSVTVDGTARVAGRTAYQLVVKPKQDGSTIGSVKIAVDSKTGTPLKFTVVPSSGGKAAIDVGFTKVDFGKPAASTFDFTPPKGAKVTGPEDLAKEAEKHGASLEREAEAFEKELEKGLKGGAKDGHDGPGLAGPEGLNVMGEGWTSIARIGASEGSGGALPGGAGGLPPEAAEFLGDLTESVKGDFGSGTLFKTRLVNALMTDSGTVYVGAVTKGALVAAANADK